MYRFLLELFILLGGGMLVKSVVSSMIKGFGAAASNSFQQQQSGQQPKEAQRSGELHKDPVCGTYVSESTSFRRQLSGKTFYYCSDACLQKHAV
jgi:YHS domain-containing protein